MATPTYRRVAHVALALFLVTSAVALSPKPVAAACYWSGYRTSERTTNVDGVSQVWVKSTVTYRTGYTCNGNVNEVNVYFIRVEIHIDGAGWNGHPRILRSHRIMDGWDGNKINYVNTRTCNAEDCTIIHGTWPNLYYYASGQQYSGSYAAIYCEGCGRGGIGGFEMNHWFVTNQISATWCACP